MPANSREAIRKRLGEAEEKRSQGKKCKPIVQIMRLWMPQVEAERQGVTLDEDGIAAYYCLNQNGGKAFGGKRIGPEEADAIEPGIIAAVRKEVESNLAEQQRRYARNLDMDTCEGETHG